MIGQWDGSDLSTWLICAGAFHQQLDGQLIEVEFGERCFRGFQDFVAGLVGRAA